MQAVPLQPKLIAAGGPGAMWCVYAKQLDVGTLGLVMFPFSPSLSQQVVQQLGAVCACYIKQPAVGRAGVWCAEV